MNPEELSDQEKIEYLINNGELLEENEKIDMFMSIKDIYLKAGLLKDNNIKYEIVHFDNWVDYGNAGLRGFGENVLRRSFSQCASAECKTVFTGRLFACPRSAHGHTLGLFPGDENDFVSLISTPKTQLKRKIKKLYSARYIQACNHCNPAWERPEIECGKQL